MALRPWGSSRTEASSGILGCRVHVFDEVPSTQDVALELAAAGAPEGTVVLAKAQTKGRGRTGRAWLSTPGGGLWFSVLLRPGLAYPASAMLPVAVGFGTVLGLRRLGVPAGLKWPNDVFSRGKKLAGVIVEGRSSGGRLTVAVAGIGINWTVPDLPDARHGVTGVAAELTAAFAAPAGDLPSPALPDPEDVLSAVLAHVERSYLVLRAAGPGPFVSLWPSVSAHFGRPCVVTRGRGEGLAEVVLTGRLLSDGRLSVLGLDGGVRALHSAEVGLGLN